MTEYTHIDNPFSYLVQILEINQLALGKCNLIENSREKGGRVGRGMEGCDVVIFLIRFYSGTI